MTTLREAAQQSLEAWEIINKYGFVLADYEGPMEHAIAALKAALEQPEQEPVAKYSDIVSDGGMDPRNKFDHPPRREWRGLTEEEISDLWSWSATAEAERTATTQQHAFASAIEAKLKELNHE